MPNFIKISANKVEIGSNSNFSPCIHFKVKNHQDLSIKMAFHFKSKPQSFANELQFLLWIGATMNNWALHINLAAASIIDGFSAKMETHLKRIITGLFGHRFSRFFFFILKERGMSYCGGLLIIYIFSLKLSALGSEIKNVIVMNGFIRIYRNVFVIAPESNTNYKSIFIHIHIFIVCG